MMLTYDEYRRINKLKRWLQTLAYASLVLDIAIAMVTLASINIFKGQLSSILFFLNVALSVEVIVTLFIFFTLIFLSRYHRLILEMTRIGKSMKVIKPRRR